ncbi:MAG: hypothetical protein LBS31_08380 [Candidatus Adiutrix sp.]|jgi:hypothetical protein|nr:hypothetical protein [Candidatus Adiutrix sp.]
MRENDEAKTALKNRPIPPEADCGPPVPPATPCTPEEHDVWFRVKVQEALDDVDEKTYSHEEVMAAAQVIIDDKRLEKELRERAKS